MNAAKAAPKAKTKRATDNTWPLMRRIGKQYLWPHKHELGWAMLAMLITAAGLSMQAHLIQPLFDNGLLDKKIGVMNTVIITLVVLTVIRGIASFYQLYFMESAGQKVVATLQQQMYEHTLRQDLGFFAQNPTGTLTSRFISDLQRLKFAVTQIFNTGLRDVGTIIGLFINMLIQDWKLTLVTLVIIPATALPIRRFGRLSRKYAQTNQESTARLTHLLSQTLQHIRQIQSYATEKHEGLRMQLRIAEVLASTMKAIKVRAVSSPVVELIATCAIALLMLYASRRIADGTLTPGSFASFVASMVMLSRPLKAITNLNNNLQEGLSAAQRAFELIDAPVHLIEEKGAKPLKVKAGKIEFKNVSLTYPDGTIALSNINLTVPAGHTVAFVGPSGAGKTSLLNLLPRFYDISGGSISIDGQDTRKATLASLRTNLALVTQDVAIFDDTIAANIAYGSPLVTTEEIHAAARAADAEGFIKQMPYGYQTLLGENGVKLSGGQRQRLSLARAIVKNAPILLLDEATAALDTRAERQVQTALEKMRQGHTTLIVAHRLSTIMNAHTIYVLEDGEIVESGNHKALLAKKGLYAKLWAMQAKSND